MCNRPKGNFAHKQFRRLPWDSGDALAADVPLDELFFVLMHDRPIVTLSDHLPSGGTYPQVVTAYTFMDFSNDVIASVWLTFMENVVYGPTFGVVELLSSRLRPRHLVESILCHSVNMFYLPWFSSMTFSLDTLGSARILMVNYMYQVSFVCWSLALEF